MIKLALADDQLLFRKGLAMLLSDMAGATVVWECANGEELLDGLKKVDVDIVLLDLEMPVMDGMEAMRRIKIEHPTVKVVVLSTHDEEKFITHLMEIGANGYMLKNVEPDEIDLAIRSVAQSGYYFSDTVSKVMLHGLVKKKQVHPTFNDIDPLSQRELEVLRAICKEQTTAEIAAELFVSPRTVEFHRNNLLLKTGARNIAGLVVYAMTRGIHTP
ncbi:MAG: response regulator transcription factor [Flavobacteriales bacterium]|jgi:DNA-binding NarL/FixJ family response regulator|nr:response regulator transcription factor [Flavobacteriales bacterium]MBK6551174.1 response regulator transcription factor [Flavobacteriales bacterium]MBK6883706.1 response regulator transcription factor [Flavobacteriales bacterium]MBK7101038.1 response regulator transcription factor [Flavobacteriales bacterium]MBK7111754.1 response regulator transcription factor [Flavobacteriales bacterium]